MNINELKPKQGSVEITAEVAEKGDVREFEKFGKKGRVCNAKVRDATGQISLTLWNEQIDQVNAGDKVKISNGYVNEWQGEPQLTTGKFGTLEVVSQEGGASAVTPDERTEQAALDGEKPSGHEHSLTEEEKTEEKDLEELGSKAKEPSPEESETPDEEIDIDEERVE